MQKKNLCHNNFDENNASHMLLSLGNKDSSQVFFYFILYCQISYKHLFKHL